MRTSLLNKFLNTTMLHFDTFLQGKFFFTKLQVHRSFTCNLNFVSFGAVERSRKPSGSGANFLANYVKDKMLKKKKLSFFFIVFLFTGVILH